MLGHRDLLALIFIPDTNAMMSSSARGNQGTIYDTNKDKRVK